MNTLKCHVEGSVQYFLFTSFIKSEILRCPEQILSHK